MRVRGTNADCCHEESACIHSSPHEYDEQLCKGTHCATFETTCKCVEVGGIEEHMIKRLKEIGEKIWD